MNKCNCDTQTSSENRRCSYCSNANKLADRQSRKVKPRQFPKAWTITKPTEKDLNLLAEVIINPDSLKFQEFLYNKLSYALEFGDVMIDHQELQKFLKTPKFKKKRRK